MYTRQQLLEQLVSGYLMGHIRPCMGGSSFFGHLVVSLQSISGPLRSIHASLNSFIVNSCNAITSNNNVRFANCIYYNFLSLSSNYSALTFTRMHKSNYRICSEMLLHRIASTSSDTISAEVISKYFVCCLYIVMFNYYNS